jgi:hypothetical protein
METMRGGGSALPASLLFRHGSGAQKKKKKLRTAFPMGDPPSTSAAAASFAGVYLLVSRATPASQRTYVG